MILRREEEEGRVASSDEFGGEELRPDEEGEEGTRVATCFVLDLEVVLMRVRVFVFVLVRVRVVVEPNAILRGLATSLSAYYRLVDSYSVVEVV